MPLPLALVLPPRVRLKAAAALVFAPLLAGCVAEAERAAPSLTAGPIVVAPPDRESRADALLVAASPYGDYLAGLVAGNQNDLSSAADFMLLVYETDPNNFDLLRRTFTLVSADGRHTEAVRLARRIVEQDPELSTANIIMAVDAVERGDGIEDLLHDLTKAGDLLGEPALLAQRRPAVACRDQIVHEIGTGPTPLLG